MPTYSYECEQGHRTRLIQHMRMERPEHLKCDTCGQRAERVFNPPQMIAFEPFVTTVGDGKKKVVRNAAEARDIERKFSVLEVGSADWKRMSQPDEMRKRREQRQAAARSALGSIRDDYAKAEAEVKTWGKDYEREWRGKENAKYEAFQREVAAGRAND